MGFKLTMPVSERPQTHALDRAATGTGRCYKYIEHTHTHTHTQKKLMIKSRKF